MFSHFSYLYTARYPTAFEQSIWKLSICLSRRSPGLSEEVSPASPPSPPPSSDFPCSLQNGTLDSELWKRRTVRG